LVVNKKRKLLFIAKPSIFTDKVNVLFLLTKRL